MEKYYSISRRIIGILAILISLVMTINEDLSMKIIATLFIFVIAFATSYLTTPISKKIIKIGDAITNKGLRILFYCAILPLSLLIAYILYVLILYIYGRSAESAGAAVMTVLLYIATTIIVIVPYIQTLIVLICRVVRR